MHHVCGWSTTCVWCACAEVYSSDGSARYLEISAAVPRAEAAVADVRSLVHTACVGVARLYLWFRLDLAYI